MKQILILVALAAATMVTGCKSINGGSRIGMTKSTGCMKKP